MATYEVALQAYCNRLWQTHECHGQVGQPFYEEHFPCLEDAELLYAVLLIENQLAGSAKGATHLEPRLWELVEDGKPEAEADTERRLRREYEAELDEFWAFNKAFTSSYARGLAWVFQQAELSPGECEVMRLHLAGDSVATIARTIKRQRSTVQSLLQAAESSLAQMAGKVRSSRARARGEYEPRSKVRTASVVGK